MTRKTKKKCSLVELRTSSLVSISAGERSKRMLYEKPHEVRSLLNATSNASYKIGRSNGKEKGNRKIWTS